MTTQKESNRSKQDCERESKSLQAIISTEKHVSHISAQLFALQANPLRVQKCFAHIGLFEHFVWFSWHIKMKQILHFHITMKQVLWAQLLVTLCTHIRKHGLIWCLAFATVISCKQKLIFPKIQMDILMLYLSVPCGKNRIYSFVKIHYNYAKYAVLSCSGVEWKKNQTCVASSLLQTFHHGGYSYVQKYMQSHLSPLAIVSPAFPYNSMLCK